MKTEKEIRDERDGISLYIDQLKDELEIYKNGGRTHLNITKKIGDETYLLWWFDWILD